jgi:peptidoglycan/xylan/chitin deacetylase (PgdA/CDA1 family)
VTTVPRERKFALFLDLLKEAAAFLFRMSGANLFIREIVCKRRVTILVYHNQKSNLFERHMRYLSKHYRFLPLDVLVQAIQSKDWSTIPPKSIVITFDDGFKENYLLRDSFKKYSIQPTIYLCSGIINTKRKFWFNSGVPNHRGLIGVANKKRLKILKRQIGFEERDEYSVRDALDLNELRALGPYVDFQAHSEFHPILTTCLDEECTDEIRNSKKSLEEILGREITHFSYPNGDYSEREMRLLEILGFKSGRTIDCGWNDVTTNPFRLKAMVIDKEYRSINKFCAQVGGFFPFLRYLRHGSLTGRHPPFL